MTKILITLTALLTFAAHCKAQIDTSPIDSIVQNAVRTNLFEGTVLIAENGKVIYHKSYGSKDTENLLPITNKTHFSIASITKLFTAIAIMQLVEERKLKLSDHLKFLLPDYDIPNAKKITIHHLLLHISGLPNESDEIFNQTKKPKEFVFETLAKKAREFGSFNYANIDYVLLGLIIEEYDKMSWSEAIQNRILDPLKMNNSGFLESQNYPENFAYSFSFDEQGSKRRDPQFFIENYYSAGCMYATSEDLLKLDQAMYDDQLLTQHSKDLMYTSYPEYNYSGYSVWTYNYPFAKSKPKIMERRGGILGANSVLIRILDTNKSLIILSNNNRFNPDSFGNTKSLKEALMIAVVKTKQ